MMKLFLKSVISGIGFSLGVLIIVFMAIAINNIFESKRTDGWYDTIENLAVQLDRIEETSGNLAVFYSISNESENRIMSPDLVYEIYDQADLLISEGIKEISCLIKPGDIEKGVIEIEKTERISKARNIRIQLKISNIGGMG